MTKKKKNNGFFGKELRVDTRGCSLQNLKPLKKKTMDAHGNMIVIEFSRQVVASE